MDFFDFVTNLLKDPGIRGFIAGLVPGVAVALIGTATTVYVDSRGAKRERIAYSREKLSKRFDLFDEPLTDFVELFKSWHMHENTRLYFYFVAKRSGPMIDDEVRESETERMTAMFARLSVAGPTTEIRESLSRVESVRGEYYRSYNTEELKRRGLNARGEKITPPAPSRPTELINKLYAVQAEVNNLVDLHIQGAALAHQEAVQKDERPRWKFWGRQKD